MALVGVDFGTCNTVLARFNETTQQTETIEIPGVTTAMRFRLLPGAPEELVHVIPSLIHFGETETLIGDQVLSRGLADHRDTLRWMKRSVAQGVTHRRKTSQGHKSPAEAGAEFLQLVLQYASDRLSFTDDAFTFTAPVEAFENFQDWLRSVCETVGIRRLRFLDEPTACVLGYQGAVRRDDRFLVFDFGGGTLDVSAVRIDLSATQDRKAVPLGQAGCDLGGMDVDKWMADDFAARHRMDSGAARELQAVLLRQVEVAKITLSDPSETDAGVTLLEDFSRPPRMLRTTYTRSCPECERGRPGKHPESRSSCLGCLLTEKGFARQVRETVERALENASVKVGLRRSDITRVLVTGGTSLSPAARSLLADLFGERVEMQRPFDAVARGSCRGEIGGATLQHDYALEGYSRERGAYEFKPLYRIGTEYPTPPDAPVRFWARGAYDGMTRIGMKIFEVSRMKRRLLDQAMVDAEGRLIAESQVQSDFEYICLNSDTPTFIVADPPVSLERDQKRFLAAFQVDGHRRLLVTVVDQHTGKTLLRDHPVVRL